jgi:hypothetical protein
MHSLWHCAISIAPRHGGDGKSVNQLLQLPEVEDVQCEQTFSSSQVAVIGLMSTVGRYWSSSGEAASLNILWVDHVELQDVAPHEAQQAQMFDSIKHLR